MDPTQPTELALEKLDRLGEAGARETLGNMSRAVREVVPQCVGLSLTLVDDDITLTLVAEGGVTGVLDAMQYLDGGPCVTATDSRYVIEQDEVDLLDEERWSMFARASAVHGVQSSLSMPILDDVGRVVAGINLYASERDAFGGHHDEIAEIVGAWSPGAVHDADLSFSTRLRAAEAPGVLADQASIDVATALIAAEQVVDRDTARRRLHEAAAKADITDAEVARTVILTRLT